MSLLEANTKKIYTAVFLTALSTLMAEIIFLRLFSVITYYYLAFFALSLAMLGMTAGAITVYIKEKYFSIDSIFNTLAISALLYSISLPVSVIAICYIPLSDDFWMLKIVKLICITFFCSLPFYFSGIIISAALTKLTLPVNKLYAADLTGAATGCICVLICFQFFDAPTLLIFLGFFGLIIALLFNYWSIKTHKVIFSVILIFILSTCSLNLFTGKIRPILVKGTREKSSTFIFEKWNSHSRVAVEKMVEGTPQLWGRSPALPNGIKSSQYKMTIDGDAGTVMRKFKTIADIDHLKYDLTNIAYYLRKQGNTCIIGVGGGKDVQAAVLFGQRKITGIDVNPVFTDLLKNRFKDFAGLANRKEISLINDDARSFLSRSDEKFDIIQMALIDTWAATGAGAFSLSENNLYTIEAWETFFNRLAPDGLLTVSRWYNSFNLGETGRLLSLAVASLHKIGVANASPNIALLTTNNLATLIVNKKGFSPDELITLRQKAAALGFNFVAGPGKIPEDETLARIINSKTNAELKKSISHHQLKLDPPTDDNPYFFNMLRLSHLNFSNTSLPGIMNGNLRATRMLILLITCLLFLTSITVILPLFIKTKNKIRFTNKTFILPGLYFSLIGGGFILLEMALIQKLTVFLGRPVYAIGILLFSLILSTGTGSLLADKLPVKGNWKSLILPVFITVTYILCISFILPLIMTNMTSASVAKKIITSLLLIFPLGLLLGIFFPTGMKFSQLHSQHHMPWFWALNGIFSVLFSSIAVFISIYAGISYNFYLSAFMYLLLWPLLKILSDLYKKYMNPSTL